MDEPCLACRVGLHWECEGNHEIIEFQWYCCDKKPEPEPEVIEEPVVTLIAPSEPEPETEPEPEPEPVIELEPEPKPEPELIPKPIPVVETIAEKKEREYKDQLSTGRKRAAKLKPIIEGMICDWAYLRKAGGGVIPIVGCEGNQLTQEKGNKELTGNIHHGPDKSTLNNNDENLHRVCSKCHNRWHTLNDPYYEEIRPLGGRPYLPIDQECLTHDKYTKATPEEMEMSRKWWMLDKEIRPNYNNFVYRSEDAKFG